MIPYYLDTSALIKHYVAELGSQWVEAVIFGPDDILLLTSRVTMVEYGVHWPVADAKLLFHLRITSMLWIRFVRIV